MSEQTTKKYSKKKYYDNVNLGKRTKQLVYICDKENKAGMFEYYIKNNKKKNTVVVVKSKRRADELCSYLNSKDIKVTTIHGNHRKEQIDKGAEEFNKNKLSMLITTDKILQSLKLENIQTIINYDLPPAHEDYFARLLLVDEVGESISFVSDEEKNYLNIIELRLKDTIKQDQLDGFEPTLHVAHLSKDKKNKTRHRNRKTKKLVKLDDTQEK